MTKPLESWDLGILGVLEWLGMELPLNVVGLAAEAEFGPKVCSGHQLRPEGTCDTSWARFLCPRSPLVPVTPGGVGTDIVSSSPLVL